MNYPIVEHSDKVKSEKAAKFKLDLAAIPVGKSCTVPFADIGEGALRTAVSRQARKLGFTCQVIKHDEYSLYEVARIA